MINNFVLFGGGKEYDPVLANNSWEDIAVAAEEGVASTLWAVGAEKPVTLNGVSYTLQIIGFDHDDLHTTDPRYSDTNYNGGKRKAALTLCLKQAYNTLYPMHSSNTNTVGWTNCVMRQTTMPLLSGYLPAELKSVLRTVSKRTSAGNVSSTINSTADQLFLLSEIEVCGTINSSFAGEGAQYAHWAAGNTRVKTQGTGTTPISWWSRSPRTGISNGYVAISAQGNTTTLTATNALGAAFGLCI